MGSVRYVCMSGRDAMLLVLVLFGGVEGSGRGGGRVDCLRLVV